MRDLLFLAHRIPYPPNKGDKIRAWHVLKHLAGSRRVHLGCFVDDESDWAHVPVLKEVCADTCFVPLSRKRAMGRSLPALLGDEPLTFPYYRDRQLAAWTRDVLQKQRPTVFVYSSAMAQYAMDEPALPRVVDFVDVDSEKWREYAARKHWPMAAIYRREGEALLRVERRIARDFAASIFVSEAEAQLFKRLAPESATRVHAVSNGVDCSFFSPDQEFPDPYAGRGNSALCFTGMMDYWPNVDAVVWFATSIFPQIRSRNPSATFWVVGANPGPAVRALAQGEGVVVTGRVPDTRPYIAHAAAVVAPLRIARGIQNKVLEAMAMARPVVASPSAFEGIRAVPGRDLLVAGREDDFAASVIRLFLPEFAETVGMRARQFVERHFGWGEQLSHLDAIIAASESEAGSEGRRTA